MAVLCAARDFFFVLFARARSIDRSVLWQSVSPRTRERWSCCASAHVGTCTQKKSNEKSHASDTPSHSFFFILWSCRQVDIRRAASTATTITTTTMNEPLVRPETAALIQQLYNNTHARSISPLARILVDRYVRLVAFPCAVLVMIISGALLSWLLWPINIHNVSWDAIVVTVVPTLLGIATGLVLLVRVLREIGRAEKWIRWAEAVGVVRTPRFYEQEIMNGELCGAKVDPSIFGAGPCAFELREEIRKRFINIAFNP